MINKILVLILAQHQKDKEYLLEKFNRDNVREATLNFLGINDKKGRNLYSVAYERFVKKLKLDKYKYSNPRFRINIPRSEINAITKSKPSGIQDEAKSVVEQITDEFEKDYKKEKETTQLITQTKEDVELSPVPYNHWSAIAIGAVFDGLLAPLRAMTPEIKGLSDEDKESIGRMFLPGFQRFGNELFQYVIFPLIGTAGILGPKIAKGRRLHKEAEKKKKQEKLDNKSTEEDRVNKLTCNFCNEIFDSAHIKGHEDTCKKRIKSQ